MDDGCSKRKNARWILKPMNFCMNYFGNGETEITKRGNFKIGRITMQRKGGDGGRETANIKSIQQNYLMTNKMRTITKAICM